MNHLELSAERTINQYFDELSSQGFELTKIQRLNYHYEFSVLKNRERIKLQVYFGKKGVKLVLQGDQKSVLYRELHNKYNTGLFSLENQEVDEPTRYIGTDESGKGDYFGPLVIAGVYLEDLNSEYLKSIGVKDSKELSDSAINKISRGIKKNENIKSNVISISPKKYNEFYSRVGNVNRILGWAHAKVIENLLETNEVDQAISDKFGDEKYIFTSLQEKGKNIALYQVTKAEKYTAVAAASILARDRFNSWFKHEKQKLGFELPKGASEVCESTAIKLVSKIGKHSLKDFVKLHFKNTARIETKII